MNELYLGWDIGGWNCDRNPDSRDALCALAVRSGAVEVVGRVWRGNLLESLVGAKGLELVKSLLDRVGIAEEEAAHVTIAIDTPLAWPKRFVGLLAGQGTVDVPAEADRNPYLFREQERDLFKRGRRPLSPVRDMIGSQSAKGIHFLERAGLWRVAAGIWSDPRGSITAIETYPAAARGLGLESLADRLFKGVAGGKRRQPRGTWMGDVRDAIVCALVAWLHRRDRRRLRLPSVEADPAEGWIWLPVGTQILE